jgi:hypothetical protein
MPDDKKARVHDLSLQLKTENLQWREGKKKDYKWNSRRLR